MSRRAYLWARRVHLWAGIVGRRWSGGARISNATAWQVACIVWDRPRRRVRCD